MAFTVFILFILIILALLFFVYYLISLGIWESVVESINSLIIRIGRFLRFDWFIRKMESFFNITLSS